MWIDEDGLNPAFSNEIDLARLVAEIRTSD